VFVGSGIRPAINGEICPEMPVPALFTSTSSRPNVVMVCSTAPLTASVSAASAWIATAFPPSRSIALTTAAAALASFTYVMATLAPSATGRFAIAAPMPREPPVTSATFSLNLDMGSPLLFCERFTEVAAKDEDRGRHGYPAVPNIEITISSQYSPDLADALVRGKLDAAFLRREGRATDLVFKVVATEPFVVVLPSDHRLASHEAINPHDIADETFIGVSNTAPVTRGAVDDYLKRSGIDIKPDHEADHLAMAMSLVASTRGVALLPAYARNLLPSSLTSRPLQGDVPTIDLVVGYSKTNASPILKLFLSRIDDLIARVSKKTH
jgi:LysR substrate binding domain